MTLVELMVAIAITGIIMTISISVFINQYKSYNRSKGVKTAQTDSQFAIEMLKEDMSLAGWGVLPNVAFYIADGGAAGTDRIYLNDITVLDPTSVADLEKIVLSTCAACVQYTGRNPDVTVTDGNATTGTGAKIPVASVPAIVWAGGTATSNYTTGATGALNTMPAGNGTSRVTPAIEYCADGNNFSQCPTAANNTLVHLWTLRKFSRATNGQMATIADNVADLQVTYSDSNGTTEYCAGGSTTCPTTFDASSVKWVKITVVTRSRDKTLPIDDPSSCRPAVANHVGASAGNSTACGYEYRTYTTMIAPLINATN